MRLILSNNITYPDKCGGLYLLSKGLLNNRFFWTHKSGFFSIWWNHTRWIVGRYEDQGNSKDSILGPIKENNWPINIREGWTYHGETKFLNCGIGDITFEDWSKVKGDIIDC